MTRFKLDAVAETVIGATDLGAMGLFLSALGMLVRPGPTLDAHNAAALYGLDAETEQLIAQTPGTPRTVRIVKTPYAPKPFQPLLAGPYGVDVYTSSVSTSRALALASGAYATQLVEYGVTGAVLQSTAPQFESRYVGPDALSVYVSDVASCGHRFPTVLDDEPERLHSEINMLVWVVDDVERPQRFWTEEAGLEVVVDRFEGEEGMLDLMAHPYPTPLRVVNVADQNQSCRLEFMHYPEARVGRRPDWPLTGGLHAAAFRVDDLERAMGSLPSARFREVTCVGTTRAVAAEVPGRTRIELWEDD